MRAIEHTLLNQFKLTCHLFYWVVFQQLVEVGVLTHFRTLIRKNHYSEVFEQSIAGKLSRNPVLTCRWFLGGGVPFTKLLSLAVSHRREIGWIGDSHESNRGVALEFVFAIALGALIATGLLWALGWITHPMNAGAVEDLLSCLTSSYEAIEDGVLAVDTNAKAIAVNDEFRRILQCDLRDGRTVSELDTYILNRVKRKDEFRSVWNDWAKDLSIVGRLEVEFDCPHVTHVVVKVSPIKNCAGELIGRLILLQDQSEKRQIRSELLHANKLEAVGRMAGGIAHDFNNVLMAIAANLSMARYDEQAKIGTVMKELSAAEEVAHRGAETVRQLLTFSSKRALDLEPHDINEVISHLSELTRHTFDASLKFEYNLDESAPKSLIEPSALEQVLLNLFVNAKDAMPQGGTITISTRKVHNPATDEQFTLISVRDTGIGVPPEYADRIFEPFFTTKDEDHGTGLGLSTSYRIVQQHGGSLTYSPCRNGGSEFQIFLPFYETANPVAAPTATTQVHHGEGRILVVDDEQIVRSVTETILRRHGYDTVSASNGRDALKCIHASDGREIDLVLLDLTMPGMTGREVMQRIREDYPSLPIVLCSGYLISTSIGSQKDGPDAEIQKPYVVKELVSIVNQVLAERRAAKQNWRATAS